MVTLEVCSKPLWCYQVRWASLIGTRKWVVTLVSGLVEVCKVEVCISRSLD